MADQHRITSANSLSELALVLGGDPRLNLTISELASSFSDQQLASGVRLLSGENLTVREFLAHKVIHRALGQRWPYQTVVGAIKAALNAQADPSSEIARGKPQRFKDLLPSVEGRSLAYKDMSLVASQLALEPAARARIPVGWPLHTFLQRADAQSWDKRLRSATLEALSQWVEHQLSRSPKVPELSRGRNSLDAFNERVEKTCIPDLLDWTVAMIEGRTDDRYFSPTLAQVLSRDLNEASARLAEFEARLVKLRSMRPVLERPADPSLAALYDAVHAERNRFAPMYPFGLCPVRANLDFDPPHLDVSVSLPGLTRETMVTLPELWRWGRTSIVNCNCSRRVCIHRVLVLESLLLWVNQPKTSGLLLEATKAPWALVLDALEPKAVAKEKRGVLSFELDANGVDFGFHELGKRGPSSKRKRMDAARVLTMVEGLDQRIAERLALAEATQSEEAPHFGDALLLLEGHPRVHWMGEAEPSPVARAVGTVKLAKTADGFRFKFLVEGQELERSPRVFRCAGGSVTIVRGAAKRILIATISDHVFKLMARTERLGAELPREAAPRLIELLPSLEAGALLDLPEDLRGEERPPAERVLVRVAPAASGLSLSIRVEPLEHGPVFVPGQGVPVSAHFDGRRRSFTRRRFEVELTAANALAGTLGLDPTTAFEPYTWLLDGSDKHVETLRRLSTAGAHVEWLAPKVKFTSEAQLGRLRLNITRKKDWFGLEGEVTVDDRRVSLAALLEAARARRRFVKLGDGDFAQL